MKYRILVIDDENHMVETLRIILEKSYEVIGLSDPSKLEEFLNKSPDLVITDIKMPELDGLKVLNITKRKCNCPVIIMTAYATVETAVNALKNGASDYLLKPFSKKDLIKCIEKNISKAPPRRSLDINGNASRFGIQGIIGNSPLMIEVFEKMQRVAKTDSTVLIRGESGVGKNIVAKNIAMLSDRRSKPYVVVDLTTLPENLFESALFGHVRGAFTGAEKDAVGKVEMANGGTLFLDEVGDIPLFLQPKIMRLIQDKSFEKVGDIELKSIDARFIAATNRDLEGMIKNKKFREDLYFRLNIFPIFIPPLRDRKEDIPELINYFIRKNSEDKKLQFRSISEEAMEALLKYEWPGNIRELSNVIERAMIVSDDEISKEHLWIKNGSGFIPKSLSELEKQHVKKVLLYSEGNKQKAAGILGIDRSTLYRLIKKYDL